MVVWFTGEGGSLSEQEELRLSEYINGGGCLILSSQDHHYVRGFTNILSEFMGLASVHDDRYDNQTMTVQGEGALYPGPVSYDLSYTFDNYTDSIQLEDAQSMFTAGDYTVGSYYETESHLGVFLGYPLEVVSSTEQRADIISRVYNSCNFNHDLSIEFTGSVGGGDSPSDQL